MADIHRLIRRVCIPFVVVCLMVTGCKSTPWHKPAANKDADLTDEAHIIEQQAASILANRGGVQIADKQIVSEPSQVDRDLIRFADKLKIDVWMRNRISQLQGFPIEVETPESGTVFLPHLGNMQVTDLSPTTLQQRLQERFSEILLDSSVIVRRSRGEPIGSGRLVGSVRGAMSIDDAPEHIVMMGSLTRPGIYSLGPNLRLREALALAGGIDERRSSPNIFIVRGSQDNPEVLRVNINDIFRGKDLSQNILLQDKDAIYVSTKRIWRVADFISTLLSPIISVREAIWVYDRLR